MVQASPYKSTAEELAALRKTFRLACRCYMERVEMEIIRVHEQVVTAGMAAAAVPESRKLSVPAGTSANTNGRAKAATAAGGTGGRAATAASAGDAHSEIHDLRDMLTLLRTLDVKPEAGRRKDLKKIESLVEDLRALSERWG